jgi:Uma2 family endonuclease
MIVQTSDLAANVPNTDKRPFSGQTVSHWHCTADQYLTMIKAGVFSSSDRVELIEGRIICMSPAEVDHNRAVSNLTRRLAGLMESYEVLVQCTVRINDDSVVDPDIAILRRPNSQDEGKLPTPADTLLLIEAAHSSLNKDLWTKSELYAKAGITEYWVADIDNKFLIVHRNPKGDRYQSIQTYSDDESVDAISVDGLSLTPAAIFG